MYIHNKEIEHQSYLIGSHNSWSYKKALKWYMRPFQFIARCQEIDVERQYIEYGVRVFDLRVSFDKKGNIVICHGLMKYDADVFEELNKLNNLSAGNIAYEQYESKPEDKVWCRVLLETSHPSKEEKEMFKQFCQLIEQMYPDILFFGGFLKKPWANPVYNFGNKISLDDNYSSVKSPKFIDDWYPKWYAEHYNKYIYAAGTDKDCLFTDFVNIR